MIKLPEYILIILVPVIALSAEIAPEEYWEEFSGEELPLLLEYQNQNRLFYSSEFWGYRFQTPDVDSSLKIPGESELFRLDDFKFTSRVSGDELDRTLLRSGADFGERIKFEFISETDPGEKFNDFYTGNVVYSTPNFTAAGGSYSAGFGQGLVLWRGFDWGAYPENPLTPLKTDFLRGYSSTAENNMLFGGGIRFRYSKAEAMLLYSDTKMDASGNDEGVLILQETGIHVSESEKENEDRLVERLLSGRLKIHPFTGLELGITGMKSEYSPPFADKDSIRYTYAFEGGENTILGTDWSYAHKNITVAAEYASMVDGGDALYASIMLNSGETVVQISGRDISEKYQNLRSVYPDGNETGISLGFRTSPWKNAEYNIYLDSWRRPWRTYNWETPPEGYEASMQYSQEIGEWDFDLRLRQTENNPEFGGTTRNQIRLNLKRDFSEILGKIRFEILNSSSVSGENTGFMISNSWGIRSAYNSIEIALSLFDVPDYECRIYQYERDVPGLISVPFYYGKGLAGNIYYRHFLINSISIAAKIGLTGYTSRPNNLSKATAKRFSLYLNYHYTR